MKCQKEKEERITDEVQVHLLVNLISEKRIGEIWNTSAFASNPLLLISVLLFTIVLSLDHVCTFWESYY